jgi:YVTN family beta-propeller protein
VSNYTSGSVSVINTSNNTVVATVTVGTKPDGVVVSPDGSRVYVPNNGSDSVSVINTLNNTVVDTVTGLSGPLGVAVSPDGSRVYVSNYTGGSVSVINTSNNTVVATVTVGTKPSAVAVSSDGSRVYVSNRDGNSVSVIDTSNNTVVATVTGVPSPVGVAVGPDGSRVYVPSLFGGSVSVIDTSNNTVVATVTVGSFPLDVAVSPDGSRVYVPNYVGGSVSVIDTSNNTVVDTVTGLSGPYGVAVSRTGSRVYVTNFNGGSVSVISAPPTRPSAPTALVATPGNGSASIAFTPGGDGGATITKYQYKVGNGSWTDAVGTTSPITITGLTNFVTASIRLRAVNAAGDGTASSAVQVWPRPAGSSLTSVKAQSSSRVVAAFAAITPVGGTVSHYWVYAYAKGTNTVAGSCRSTAAARSCVIGRLSAGTEYDVAVRGFFTLTGSPTVLPTTDSTRQTVRTRN